MATSIAAARLITCTRANRRLLVAGGLAIASAVLAVVGLFPPYQFGVSLGQSLGWWPIVITAALYLSAGACMLIPRAGPLIGSGLLLGAVAASSWALMVRVRDLLAPDGYSGGFWLQLASSLILVVAACLAGLALARATEARLVRRPPRSALPWVVILLGAAGALALVIQDRNLAGIGSRVILASSIWLTVMALVVPACAAVAVPRRLGVALLAGWIGGGAASYLYYYYLLEGAQISIGPTIAFGLTLLALSVAAVPFARTTLMARAERVA